MNVLLIDKDEVFLNQLTTELGNQQLSIKQAHSDMMALKILSEEKIDLILTNAEIPGKQVLLFVCSLKGRYPNTPLILLAGTHPDFNVKTALLLGADAMIPKNLNLGQLYSTIHKYVA